ncbi:cilia- and flagella-associated protein 99-like [Ptychodera flava]|uniref:cilia- and flagella-associated protein 99-like n=1 Tax=Ptychodera flava TaxID=63121 RepID=UPI00396AAFF6
MLEYTHGVLSSKPPSTSVIWTCVLDLLLVNIQISKAHSIKPGYIGYPTGGRETKMNHKEILQHCVQILDSFNPAIHGVEGHLSQYLQENKNLDKNDQTFVTEVFSGCVRHARIMKVVISGYYVEDGKTCLRTDLNLYTVLCYLALFRLSELRMSHYGKFIRSQDVNKMHKFLAYFVNEHSLKTWMKDEWCRIYETTYVQTEILSPILSWLPELNEIIQHLAEKIANKLKAKKQTKGPTQIKPFNITKPRPRSVRMPEPIPTLKPHQPVPKTTYEKPKEQKEIEKMKELHRRRAEEQLLESSKSQFSCANAEKSEKAKNRLAKIVYEQDSKLNFEKNRARPLPPTLNNNVPIRLNAAAILREGALYQKKEDEELKKLARLESGARDATDFLQWQSEMRQKDMDENLAEIEQRRIAGKLSHEEAILARQQLIMENKQKVQEMKEEAERLMQEYLERRLEEEEMMKELVEDVMMSHQNAKDAKSKLTDYKRKLVEEVNEESRELLRQALEEAEADMRRKLELIQQIRAMESVPKIKHKFVDLSSTAGHALLSEMSIAELRERLALLKIASKEGEEEKRDEILAAKQAKDQLLMEKLEQISRHRSAGGQTSALRLEDKRRNKGMKPDIRDPKVLELQERLEQRRQERISTAEKMKITPTKKSAQRTQSLAKEKKQLEASRWRELERTTERAAALQSQGVMRNRSANKLASFRQLSAGQAAS